MCLALIDYLEQKVPSLPFPTTWDSQRLDLTNLASKNYLFEQAVFELMFLVAGREKMFPPLSSALSKHIGATASFPCKLSPRSHRWLEIRIALEDLDLERFLDLACPLIASGPEEADWFWYGIVMDLVVVCKHLSFAPAQQLLQVIAGDMTGWRWRSFPSAWKKVYEDMSGHVSL